MKIIAVGRNYADHAKELNNPTPTTPIIFLKPETALLKNNKPFYHPDFSDSIDYEVEVVLKIAKEGKHIAEQFASNYFEEISLGVDFTARDIQQKCKENGLPWELAKAFDQSAYIGHFIPKQKFNNIYDLNFRLEVNNQIKQNANTSQLLFSFEHIISFVSKYITLKKGDLIFTGTPQGVGKINIGDWLTGYIEEEQFFNFDIR